MSDRKQKREHNRKASGKPVSGGARLETKNEPQAEDPAQVLQKDATDAARALKRKYRNLWERDPGLFRKVVRKAQGRVFHRKPGPKPNPGVRAAALERAQGAAWEVLYPKYIAHMAVMNEQVRAYAIDGFRRKVNGYLQRHPALRRNLRKKEGGPVG